MEEKRERETWMGGKGGRDEEVLGLSFFFF